MLQQEINLYQHFVKVPSHADYFTWRRYWAANFIFLIFLVLLYFNAIFSNHRLASELLVATADISKYENSYKTLKNTMPQFLFSSNVNDTVNNLKKELDAQKLIVGILSKHNLFSKNLIALSNSIVPNVWLTKFAIEKDGDTITLTGNSFGLDNLHTFIDHLNKEKAFDKYEVTIKQINNQNAKESHAKLTFELNMVKSSNG